MFGIVLVAIVGMAVAYLALRQTPQGRAIARRAATGAIILIVILLVLSFFRIVPPGFAGVPVLLGRVQKQMSSGLNVVIPIVNVTLMDVRTNAYTMSSMKDEGQVKGDDAIDALASNGLTVALDVTVWYRLDVSKASWVFQNIGPDYTGKIVRPSIRTALRDAASRFTASELYSSTGRTVYTSVVDSLLDVAFAGKGIIKFPKKIEDTARVSGRMRSSCYRNRVWLYLSHKAEQFGYHVKVIAEQLKADHIVMISAQIFGKAIGIQPLFYTVQHRHTMSGTGCNGSQIS